MASTGETLGRRQVLKGLGVLACLTGPADALARLKPHAVLSRYAEMPAVLQEIWKLQAATA